MLDVNDDMDELYRRAAENYPLNTDSHDWNKVAAELAVTQPEGKSKNWFKGTVNLLFLLFILPAALICNHYSDSGYKDSLKVDASLAPQTYPIKKKMTQGVQGTAKNTVGIQKREKRQIIAPVTVKYQPAYIATQPSLSIMSSGLHKRRDFKDKPSASASPSTLAEQMKEKPDAIPETSKADEVISNNNNLLLATDERVKMQTEDQVISPGKQESVPVKKDKIHTKKTTQLYAGIIGNIDVSSVKFQSARAPGIGAGIVIGYQLNKHVSIESGIYWQKKFYYSDAKYYNPKTPYTAPSYKLLNVDGNCTMYEIPFNVKYDFKIAAKSKWFAVAGMSSYFMKKENYTYTSESWGRTSQKDISYDNSSNTWLSVINVSAGYQHQLGRSGTFRVEPYLKLPVKGFGWGRLPIMSGGISVGYIKTIY